MIHCYYLYIALLFYFPFLYENTRNYECSAKIRKSIFFPSLTLLHSERPKLCGVLAVLSAIGLKSVMSTPLSTQKIRKESLGLQN